MLVIPAIDLMDGKCVRLFQGDYEAATVYRLDPVEQAQRLEGAGFKRLHIVDLDAARDGVSTNRPIVEAIRAAVEIPIQFGGGVRGSKDVRELLGMGVDYLIVGTMLLSDPRRFQAWTQTLDPDCFIAALDLKQGTLRYAGWTRESALSLEECVSNLNGWGVRRILSTDIDRDGTLEKPNDATCRMLRGMVSHDTELILAGGISRPGHISLLRECGADGAVVGRAIYQGEVGLEDWVHAG